MPAAELHSKHYHSRQDGHREAKTGKAIEARGGAGRQRRGAPPDGLMNAAISGVRPDDPRLRQPYRNVDKRGKMPKEEL